MFGTILEKADVTGFTRGGGSDQDKPPWADSWRQRRQPNPRDLIGEIKNFAFTCAKLNASTCASLRPKLYVKTSPGEWAPKCETVPIDYFRRQQIQEWSDEYSGGYLHKADDVQEVPSHPLLDLLIQANPAHDWYDLLENLALNQEIFGCAYWLIERDMFDPYQRVIALWPLPTDAVEEKFDHTPAPMRMAEIFMPNRFTLRFHLGSRTIFRDASPEEIIYFRIPDIRNPYMGGSSPYYDAWESIKTFSENIATQLAFLKNRARPDVVVSPAGAEGSMGDEERERFEKEWMIKFRQGGTGLPLIAKVPLNVNPLSYASAAAELSAQHQIAKEEIANAFGVPMSYVTKETNLSNIQSSDTLYMRNTIRPRIYRRDMILTYRLCRMFDPRLFFWSEDPTPEDLAAKREQQRVGLEHGTTFPNEVRAEEGKPPVPWGDEALIPSNYAPATMLAEIHKAAIQKAKQPQPSGQNPNRKKEKSLSNKLKKAETSRDQFQLALFAKPEPPPAPVVNLNTTSIRPPVKKVVTRDTNGLITSVIEMLGDMPVATKRIERDEDGEITGYTVEGGHADTERDQTRTPVDDAERHEPPPA